MTLTPTRKGQLTKALNAMKANNASRATIKATIRGIFRRDMPREQANHAMKKYLATH